MTRYPLTWPAGWQRSHPNRRKNGKFSSRGSWISVHQAIHRVLTELQRLGVADGDSIISTNIPTRLDGLPRSDQSKPDDPGVAVYWERPGDKGTKVMAVDAYTTVEDNIAAIAATLEAMRAIERHGGAKILERAFAGFDALPAPGQTSRSWKDVLGVGDDPTFDQAERAYKTLRSIAHPDKPGGDANQFHEIEQAWKQAWEALQ